MLGSAFVVVCLDATSLLFVGPLHLTGCDASRAGCASVVATSGQCIKPGNPPRGLSAEGLEVYMLIRVSQKHHNDTLSRALLETLL